MCWTHHPMRSLSKYKDQVGLLHQQVLTILLVQGDTLLHHGPDGGRWAIVQWRTWLIGGPPSPRPGTMHLQTSNSAIRIVEGHFITQEKTNHLAMRISQCVRQAQQLLGTGGSGAQVVWDSCRTPANCSTGSTFARCTLWQKADPPDLDRRWSSFQFHGWKTKALTPLLKKQFKLCAQGEVGWIASKYIISAYFSVTRPRWKTNQDFQKGDGRWMGEGRRGRDTGSYPPTRRQLEHMHLIFRTNLLMAILSFPSMLKVEHHPPGPRRLVPLVLGQGHCWPDVRPPVNKCSFMRREMHGERSTTWSMGAWASRKPWCNFGRTPSFWTREVYESVARQKGHKGTGGTRPPQHETAKAKGRQPPWSPA